MKPSETDLTFIVPLSYEAHQIAEQQLHRQYQPERAKQVYLNRLAVYAVAYYLRCLGWQTDCRSSDSCNSLFQQFIDSADLLIPGLGRLECRPVLPGQSVCEIPPEVWEDRLGYVAVQFEASLRQAEILGFVQSPATAVPLDRLQSLDDLLIYLDQLQPTVKPDQPIRLSEWLENVFTTGWQAIEVLWPPEPGLAFRHDTNRPTAAGSKVINFGNGFPSVILVITHRLTKDGQIDVRVELKPSGQLYLPVGLQIAVLDGQEKSFLTAETRVENPPVQLEFSGESGDTFSVRITLGDSSVTEDFLL